MDNLKTSEERIKLLKAGFSGKEIEQLYVELNNFEIVSVKWGVDLGETLWKLRKLVMG